MTDPGDRASKYLPIEDYGAIGNLRTVALVGRDGSIDWCAFPHVDRPSVFAALLDAERGGCFRVSIPGAAPGEQRYVEDTNVLETVLQGPGGRLRVTDFMPLAGDLNGRGRSQAAPELHRLLAAEGGPVDVEVVWAPRLDYARAATRIERRGGEFVATDGADRLTLGGLDEGSAAEVRDAGHGSATLRARLRLPAGGQRVLVCRWNPASGADGADLGASEAALERTSAAWRGWLHKEEAQGRDWSEPWRRAVLRSELALKLLTHADSGAIAAAATTSLPETLGGSRNWDYRFTWIRDAAMTIQALVAMGHAAEALDFVALAERLAETRTEAHRRLRIMYGLHGEDVPEEELLDHLEGYRGSRPVRIGNGAAGQVQHDIYGELLIAADMLVRRGLDLGDDVWAFLPRIADAACADWREPDSGIWEMRGEERHYVHSKLLVWVALDSAVHLAKTRGLAGDVARWRRSRADVRRAILEQGYDPDQGAFVQTFGGRDLDASALLIPLYGLLPHDDPRAQGTVDAVLRELTEEGLVFRYRADDGLPGEEGAMLLCTFWLVDALTRSDRLDEAQQLFERLVGRANHVGLYSEQIDPASGAFLGNFPQAFSHIGLINSALYIAHARGRGVQPAAAPSARRRDAS